MENRRAASESEMTPSMVSVWYITCSLFRWDIVRRSPLTCPSGIDYIYLQV